MPTHKGIKLSVVSQWELQIHPEFRHPDSSQFSIRSPDLTKVSTFAESESSDSKADRVLGAVVARLQVSDWLLRAG